MRPGRGLTYGLLLAVAAAGCGSKSQAPRFETTKVERGKLVARVTATGTLSALVTVQVGSQVSGRIASLGVDFNDRVKKGQIVAKIDPQLYQAAAEQAHANLVAAQGNLAKAKAQAVDARRQAQRSDQLADKKLVAAADRDTAQANAEAADAAVAAAQGAVEQAKASLHQADVNLAYTTIKSPIDGVVISRSVDVGQTVAASLQAPTLFTIAEDLQKMQVDTSVAEADVGKVQPGMKAAFTVDAYPGEKFQGTVRQIRNSPTTVQNVVTYDAVIDVANPDLKLKPGMTATVTFVYAEKDDALRVANAALRFRPSPDYLRGRGKGDGKAGDGKVGDDKGDGKAGDKAVAGDDKGGVKVAALDRPERKSASDASPGPAGGGGRRGERPPNERTVWKLGADNQLTPIRIKVGVSDGTNTEITEGAVAEGDVLVTEMTGGGAAGGPPGGGGGRMRGPF